MRPGFRIALLVASLSAALAASVSRPAWAQTQPEAVPTSPPATASQEPAEKPPAETPKNFKWTFDWKGWDGLHYTLRYRKPNDEAAPKPAWAQAWDFSQVAFVGKFGARFAADAASFWNTRNVTAENGWELRRARVYWSGDSVLLTPWSFKLEWGYSASKFYLDESYIAFTGFHRVGVLWFGQFQAPMGMEAIASKRDVTFMEPSSAVMALAPGTNAGAQLWRPAFGERLTWALGLFTNPTGTDYGDASKSATRLMGRVTGLLVDRRSAAVPSLVHLGLSASHLYSGADTVRYRSRPESNLAPYMVDTGEMKARSADTLAFEAAWVEGPLSVQGEGLYTRVNTDDYGNRRMGGTYVYASWFLTGESRPYNTKEGVFTRVIPSQNFSFKGGGRGAVEVAIRYSLVDLNDGPVHGGKMRSFTAGLNWYLNPNSKVRVNYVSARCEQLGVESDLAALQVRFEFDF